MTTKEIAEIQKEMIGFDKLIRPYYSPKLSIEDIDSKKIIVLWVLAGNERPYEVPESIVTKHKKIWKYYIRRYASSIEATGADKEELIALSNNIPFDDRANTQANIKDISMVLVQNHLRKIESKLADDIDKLNTLEVLQQMALLSGPIEYIFPRNVSLMMFTENPSKFFPYTQVDIVYFPNGEAEPFTEYPKSTGTIPEQIKSTLDFLKMNFLKELVIKPKYRAESIRVWNYPLQAIEEIIVNAFYHRDYQTREPIEIRIYKNSIIFLNYGGPDRSIQLQSFQTGQVRPRRYRNRRLGDFLKELELTEGRATGIPTIFKALKYNGSPLPRFNTDEDHTFFEVELFVHPAFEQKQPIVLELDKVIWNIDGVDNILNNLLEKSDTIEFSNVTNNIAGGIVEYLNNIDNQSIELMNSIEGGIVEGIARGIAGGIAEKYIRVLSLAKVSQNRRGILKELNLVNNANNFETYIQPLVAIEWISMTLPEKPTSPKQQYITTLKGRLIIKFLQAKLGS